MLQREQNYSGVTRISNPRTLQSWIDKGWYPMMETQIPYTEKLKSLLDEIKNNSLNARLTTLNTQHHERRS